MCQGRLWADFAVPKAPPCAEISVHSRGHLSTFANVDAESEQVKTQANKRLAQRVSRCSLIFTIGHNFGGPEQFGTECESCCLCRVEVDAQMNLAIYGGHANDPAFACEAIDVADRKNTVTFQALQCLRHPLRLGAAQEQYLAILDLRRAAITLHHERSSIDLFTAHRIVEHRAEWILAQHADHQRTSGVRESIRRPLDKLREVDQE